MQVIMKYYLPNTLPNKKQVPPYTDIYVLTPKRNKTFIKRFLDHIVPLRDECAESYEVPQYGGKNTAHTFNHTDAIIDYLVVNSNEPYSLYFENRNKSDIHFAMLFFTNDGNLIIGISTPAGNTTQEQDLLKQLLDFAESDDGYITFEEPPPDDADAFREFARRG